MPPNVEGNKSELHAGTYTDFIDYGGRYGLPPLPQNPCGNARPK
jgi:hypothetical protein